MYSFDIVSWRFDRQCILPNIQGSTQAGAWTIKLYGFPFLISIFSLNYKNYHLNKASFSLFYRECLWYLSPQIISFSLKREIREVL